MNRVSRGEWPLVVFTVGLQMAAGIALMVAVESWLIGTGRSIQFLSVLIFPILLVATIGSLFHLGRPLRSWRALTNVGRSRLSAELVMVLGFGGIAFLQAALCWSKGTCPVPLEVGTAIVGLLAVFSSARLYTIPAQPLWNSRWTHASFVGSMLLLGGVTTLAIERSLGGGSSALVLSLTSTGAVLLVVALVMTARSILSIRRQSYTEPETVPLLQWRHWAGIGGVVASSVVAACYCATPSVQNAAWSAVVMLLTLAAVSCSRAILYSRGIELSRF